MESSLNDIFRFVEFKSSGLLKLYQPLRQDYFDVPESHPNPNDPNAPDPYNGGGATPQKLAENFLTTLNFSLKDLEYGTIIYNELDEVRAREDVYTLTIQVLYDAVEEQGVLIGESAFMDDLDLLSKIVYAISISSPHLKPSSADLIVDLYIVYHLLKIGHESEVTKSFLLDRRLFGNTEEAAEMQPFIKSVGVADLLVVKQHILKYEKVEIANIINVMKGEKRSKEHRYLDRYEETFTREVESTLESETESESTERFKMNREVSKTIQEDQKFSTDLSLSGKYGPTISFDSNLAFGLDRSTTTESRSSTEYAKDIVDRSLERIKERTREERITKILKENEITNLHSFENIANDLTPSTDLEHFSGIYQFVDKIYKAQVFNYGKRQMFDLMIPEPASYLWHLKGTDKISSRIQELEPPPAFNLSPLDIKYLPNDEGNIPPEHYSKLASTYKASGISPAPISRTITFSHQQPASGDGALTKASESGQWFKPVQVLEVDIPENHIPVSLDIEVMAFSDRGEFVQFTFQVGNAFPGTAEYRYSDSIISPGNFFLVPHTGDTSGSELAVGRLRIPLIPTSVNPNRGYQNPIVVDSKFKISYMAFESANHTITGKISCTPSEELIQQWQLETYQTLLNAHQNLVLDYESKVAQIKAEETAEKGALMTEFGVPPTKQKQVILNELKKHAISILTNNHLTSPAFIADHPLEYDTSETDPLPPTIDRVKAKRYGDFVRFFEQAFEWNQIQYAFYPYFWSRQEEWDNKFNTDENNYEYQQFLQAGAARLVLPVRNNFVEAVNYFLEKGEIWNGTGSPTIKDPLYVGIVDEIREQTGNPENEPVPVGEPWEVRVPTNLIILRKDETLPEWTEDPASSWNWEEG